MIGNTMSKQEELMKLVTQVNGRIKKGNSGDHQMVMMAGQNAERLIPNFVPCNVPEINTALGGGFARGAMHLIAGKEGAGKTALSLSVMKSIQDMEGPDGGYCIYVCLEPPFPYHLAKELGLDMDRLLILDPIDYGEQIIDTVYDFLYDDNKRTTRNLISGVVWDSINNTIAKRTVDGEDKDGAERADVGSRALMLTRFFEKLQGRGMLRDGTLVMLIAQYRANLDNPTGRGPKDIISGGRAAQYDAKTIITLAKRPITESVDGISMPVGQEVGFKVVKNNIGAKPTAGKYFYDYQKGVDDTRGIIVTAEEKGFISKTGRNNYIFECPGHERVEEKLKKAEIPIFLKDNPELLEALRVAIIPTNKTEDEEVVTASEKKETEEIGEE